LLADVLDNLQRLLSATKTALEIEDVVLDCGK